MDISLIDVKRVNVINHWPWTYISLRFELSSFEYPSPKESAYIFSCFFFKFHTYIQWKLMVFTFCFSLQFTSIFPPSFMSTHQVQLVLPICAWVWGHQLEHGNLPVATSSVEWFSLLHSRSADNSSSVRNGTRRSSTPSLPECWLAWFCVGFLKVTTLLGTHDGSIHVLEDSVSQHHITQLLHFFPAFPSAVCPEP